MDVAKTLIRTVVRAFYDTRCALVVDALFIHSVIHAEDLAYLMGMQSKDLRRVCGELKNAKLISSHSKSEVKEGSNRTTSRDYYFIPFHPVIDGIKFRIMELTKKVKAQYIPSSERKALSCPRCHATYTELEAMSNMGPEGFECERCGHLLENEDESKLADQTGYEKQSRLMAEIEKLLSLLKQVDQTVIPPNDFDDAWEKKVDVKRVETPSNRPSFPGKITKQNAVRGAVGSTDASNLNISVSSTAELTAAQEAEEIKRKADLLAKNATPDWFTHSTVAGAGAVSGRQNDEPSSSGTSLLGTKRKLETEEDSETKKALEASAMDDELKGYYAEMAREREREAKENAMSSSDGDEDGEDEDGFEDVNVSTPASGPLNPSSQPPTSNGVGLPPTLHNEDESMSESSSAPPTSTATPADSSALDAHPPKRFKIDGEESAVASPDKSLAAAVKAEEDEEDSDEDEADFEDV